MGPGTVYSRQREHAVPSRLAKPMTLESDRLYFLSSKITTDGDCSHEIKRHLLFGRKAMTDIDSILKSRDITFQQRPI